MKVQCFRVSKGKNGGGLYSSIASMSMFELEGAHPAPHDDAALADTWEDLESGLRREYIFGFKSLDQLRQWIYKKDWREELDAEDYQVHTWEMRACMYTHYVGEKDRLKGTLVRPYLLGDTQMVFMPVYFTYIDSISLLTV